MGCACVKIANAGPSCTGKIPLFKQLIGTPPTMPNRGWCMAGQVVQVAKPAPNADVIYFPPSWIPLGASLPIVILSSTSKTSFFYDVTSVNILWPKLVHFHAFKSLGPTKIIWVTTSLCLIGKSKCTLTLGPCRSLIKVSLPTVPTNGIRFHLPCTRSPISQVALYRFCAKYSARLPTWLSPLLTCQLGFFYNSFAQRPKWLPEITNCKPTDQTS